MRLLNTTSLELAEFTREDRPPYAILSHTWGDEEVTLQDMKDPASQERNGFAKLASFCAQARRDNLDWAWADTCCIDKSSSAELSEAINSMYGWYAGAAVCYVYLFDVPPLDPFLDVQKFEAARWFARGWCLQELIAPHELEFYASDWSELGTKSSLQSHLVRATGIPRAVLMRVKSPADCNVAERFSWASRRQVTRVEDAAYCLLGVFDINMPPLYGEGRRAMVRLQEEILRRDEDPSIFLWQGKGSFMNTGLLCDSPSYFPLDGVQTQSGMRLPYGELERHRNVFATTEITGRGLRIELLTRPHRDRLCLAWMFFKYQDHYVCIVLGECASHAFAYERVLVHYVHLLTEEDLRLTPFTQQQVYLPPFYELSVPRVISDSFSFRLSLHSTDTTTLSLVNIYPDHRMENPEPGVFKHVYSVLDCPDKVALLIRVSEENWNSLVIVVWKLFNTNRLWGCFFRRYEEGSSLQQLVESREVPQPRDGELSDRALFALPTGSHLRAALKSRTGSCSAHLALLPPHPPAGSMEPGIKFDVDG
ncbi:hypothetical protein QQS21_007575 [Conoideocrella luteorostrata]|uniref:Heterokaryon incompatibility domain-containing protein n=1 Tax=Conoideocrella luteorostrata TaxID=1105319 RepID=A0AAJ0CKG2_9HYPO|nr:hypothetical protein QQS21_007575 [Conoideocrella luteorostrata]